MLCAGHSRYPYTCRLCLQWKATEWIQTLVNVCWNLTSEKGGKKGWSHHRHVCQILGCRCSQGLVCRKEHMVTYKAPSPFPWSGIYLNGFPNSPTAKPMWISQHTKPGSFYRKSSSTTGRIPVLLIYNKIHNCQVVSYLLSSIVFPFRQSYLKRQMIIRRVLDGWVQSKNRSEGILFMVSSSSDRIGDFHLHYSMFLTGFEVTDSGQGLCLPWYW